MRPVGAAECGGPCTAKNVFPTRPLVGLLDFLGHTDHLVPSDRLRALLRRHVNYNRLEEAPIPVRVVTTEVTTGMEIVLGRGDVVDAVAASAAIPGIFPAVTIEGRQLVDGGVANNTPISHAVEAGASTIFVLPTGYACAMSDAPRGALGMALQAITLLVQQRLMAEVARYQDTVDLRVLPPLCPLNVSPLDFSHTSELIEQAHESSAAWLDRSDHGTDQTLWLRLHRHDPADLAPTQVLS